MKKCFFIILAVLLTVGVGLAVPLMINSEKDGTEKVNTEADKSGEQTMIPQANVTPTLNESSQTVTGTETVEIIYNTPGKKASGKPKASGKYTPAAGLPSEAKSGTENTMGPAPTPEPEGEGSSNWVEEKIKKYKEDIDPGDLADFRRIYPRVDIGYIQSLGRDGYTQDEVDQIKSYLRKTLGGDYERAKELFYEYNYLLSEDE